jgi:hypothetical protein
MPTSNRSFFTSAGAGLASLALACNPHNPSQNDEAQKLIELSRESNAALLRGDGERYFAMIKQAPDFTLMSPFGGKPTRGAISPERMKEIGKFFKNGSLEQQLVQAYSSRDMIVLATIERAHVQVGELPAQNWALPEEAVCLRKPTGPRLNLVN